MTREEAIELARQHAKRTDTEPYHEYQPTPETVRDWMPHEWVLTAILAAYDKGHEDVLSRQRAPALLNDPWRGHRP